MYHLTINEIVVSVAPKLESIAAQFNAVVNSFELCELVAGVDVAVLDTTSYGNEKCVIFREFKGEDGI